MMKKNLNALHELIGCIFTILVLLSILSFFINDNIGADAKYIFFIVAAIVFCTVLILLGILFAANAIISAIEDEKSK